MVCLISCAGTVKCFRQRQNSNERMLEAEDLSKYRPKFNVPETNVPGNPDPGANPFTPLPVLRLLTT